MNITQKSMAQLEILISTMNRNSLDFLDAMFINNDLSKLQILVINQTHKDCILSSDKPNIRVFNSFEKGLSKSRNLALKNALAPLVLISDDDVVYEINFDQIIIESFSLIPKANVITFKAKNFESQSYRDYPNCNIKHNLKTIKEVISWEIALNLIEIRKLGIRFDERFGLGAEFETAEEFLFVREVLKNDDSCYFYDKCIVSHPNFNTGMDLGSDKIVYARAALNYKLYGILAYFWLAKYLFFLVRHHYINLSDIMLKWKQGVKAIYDYKS